MKIKIDDYWELNSVLREVQRNARVRVILSPDVITEGVERLEGELAARALPRKYWRGLRYVFNPNAQKFPHAYKGTPEATLVTIERFSKDWFVVGVERALCTSRRWSLDCTLTGEQVDALARGMEVLKA